MKKLFNLLVAFVLLVGIVPVFADTTTGKITITNAANGKEYKVYEILHLESYDNAKKAYAYKATSTWNSFVNSADIKGVYLNVDTQGYVTWVENADVKAFAEIALKYAKDNDIDPTATKKATADGSLVFDGLDLGYYLVDSSMGALCGLTTTKPEAEINEKNTIPTIEKKVKEDSTGNYGDTNTAQIGDVIDFRTTVTAGNGAENYVIHDTMTSGLTLLTNSIVVKVNGITVLPSTETTKTYTVTTTSNGFTITFDNTYSKDFTSSTKIVVEYQAKLNENAIVGKVADNANGNDNDTYLSYGTNHETSHDKTRTYTFSFDLVKTDSNGNKLEGAEFILLDKNKVAIPVVKVGTTGNTYRVAVTGETGVNIVVGRATIEGLDSDTYYLKEVKQPAGYNILASEVEVKIVDSNNSITNIEEVKNNDSNVVTIKYTGGVQVINTTGAELPSTGSFGTFMFVFMGTLTVLVCGILLVTKFRMSKISA